jgi:alpha-beta hydrolase superfamily lysophospholipase
MEFDLGATIPANRERWVNTRLFAGMRNDIEFEGFDGTTLRGWWYEPPERSAAIAMAHGFSAVKEMALDAYAERLCAAGFGVLVYDHRNFGASEGEPRQEVDPWGQVWDFRRALDWLEGRADVDPERLGLWGSSFSGGEAIILAACDERVRAVVANVPLAGFPGVEYADTSVEFASIRDWVLANPNSLDRNQEAVLGPFAVVEEAGNDLTPYLPQPESAEWFLRFAARPASTWQNRITLRNAFAGTPRFDPGLCVAHVAPTPLLLVVASEDRLAATDVTFDAFARAGEPKQLVTIAGHHFVPYEGAGFEAASRAACDFFASWLA